MNDPHMNTSLNEVPILLLIAKEDLQTPYGCDTCLLRNARYQRCSPSHRASGYSQHEPADRVLFSSNAHRRLASVHSLEKRCDIVRLYKRISKQILRQCLQLSSVCNNHMTHTRRRNQCVEGVVGGVQALHSPNLGLQPFWIFLSGSAAPLWLREIGSPASVLAGGSFPLVGSSYRAVVRPYKLLLGKKLEMMLDSAWRASER